MKSILERAKALSQRPVFYHTLHNTCATNLAGHLREINEPTRRWDWRVILPGYSNRLARARGWIDDEDDLSLRELRRRYRINDRSAWTGGDTASWSRQIRQVDRPPVAPLRDKQQGIQHRTLTTDGTDGTDERIS